MELSPGMILQNYQIIQLLGKGGMGEVYLAEETLLGRKVAIKRLNPLLTQDTKLIERFKNEAKAQARLNHPQIVALHNFFSSEGAYYIVMEYASGITLDRLMQQTGLLPEERAMPIFKQVCEALSYAHKRAIVHRDIKPSNIMIDVEDEDTVKIMDFGIARIMDSAHLTQTGTQMGTIHYMSPEQVHALKDIDHRSDIYSAGVLLYRMLTGRLPFDADTDSTFHIQKQIVDAPLPDPREIYAHISEETVQLLSELTQKDRDKRPAEILQAFNHCCGGKQKTNVEPQAKDSDYEEEPLIESSFPAEDIAEPKGTLNKALVWVAISALVIIVGVAIAVGIQMFNSQSYSSNKSAIAADAQSFATDVVRWYKTPVSQGGAGSPATLEAGVEDNIGNFIGWGGTTTENENGSYTIDEIEAGGTTVVITGTGKAERDGKSPKIETTITFPEGEITADASDD